MCSISWIVLTRDIRRVLLASLLTVGFIGWCQAGTLTGVIISDHSGPSADAVGEIRLVASERLYRLLYGEPLVRRFSGDVCYDIGAIWTVEFHVLPDSALEIESASCTGDVDEPVHRSWLLVRSYLHSPQSSEGLLSQRWRKSLEFTRYSESLKGINLSDFSSLGKRGTCIDVTHRSPDRIRLDAGIDCYISLAGEPVDLIFSCVRPRESDKWEIDRIEISKGRKGRGDASVPFH